MRQAIDFQFGNANRLPFPDASFHGVISTFGAIFAQSQQQAARELGRVTRKRPSFGWRRSRTRWLRATKRKLDHEPITSTRLAELPLFRFAIQTDHLEGRKPVLMVPPCD